MTAVPDVVGMTVDEAVAELTAKGFLVTKDYQYHDTVEEGKVISQTPEAKTQKKEGTRVTIVISEGQNTKLIPNSLIGKTEAEVVAALEELGFVADVVRRTSNGAYPAGIVFDIDGVGTEVPVGTKVLVYLSNDDIAETETVPTDLVGLQEDVVKQALEELGFEVKVEKDSESTEAAGTVTRVEGAGEEKEVGSTVTIYVSEGGTTAPSESESTTPNPSESASGSNE